MCLTARKKFNKSIRFRTALEKAIEKSPKPKVVWKVFYVGEHDRLVSPFRGTMWYEGTTSVPRFTGFISPWGLYRSDGRYELHISKGLHAYTTSRRAKDACGTYDHVERMIIPAHTPYVLGEGSTIVSLKLRFAE